MNSTIQYNGYVGSVEFSEEYKLFYGKVLGIRSLISYEGSSATELLNDFHGAVDDYLQSCKDQNKEPKIAFKYIETTLEEPPAAKVDNAGKSLIC